MNIKKLKSISPYKETTILWSPEMEQAILSGLTDFNFFGKYDPVKVGESDNQIYLRRKVDFGTDDVNLVKSVVKDKGYNVRCKDNVITITKVKDSVASKQFIKDAASALERCSKAYDRIFSKAPKLIEGEYNPIVSDITNLGYIYYRQEGTLSEEDLNIIKKNLDDEDLSFDVDMVDDEPIRVVAKLEDSVEQPIGPLPEFATSNSPQEPGVTGHYDGDTYCIEGDDAVGNSSFGLRISPTGLTKTQSYGPLLKVFGFVPVPKIMSRSDIFSLIDRLSKCVDKLNSLIK